MEPREPRPRRPGRAGAWNSLGFLTTTPQPLVGLWGQPIPVTVYALGGSEIFSFNHAATAGDDEALMDDMFLSTNSPVDLCLYFQGLQNGEYEAVMYGMDPDSPTHLNRVRVDNSNPGPTWIGGAWPGFHALGVTYSRHTLSVTNGRIYPHAGEYGGAYRSGVNGLQIIFLGECYANCDGSSQPPILNVNDFICFFNRFAAGDPIANCDHSVSPPTLNVNDFLCFMNAYASGCN